MIFLHNPSSDAVSDKSIFAAFHRIALFFLLFLVIGHAGSAFCSDFGKNKVAWRQFDWKLIRTAHFTVYYYEGQGELSRIAARWAEEIYADLSARFDFNLRSRTPLIIYDSRSDFRQTNVIGALLPEGVNGFTTQLHRRVVIPFDGSFGDFRHVLHHELVHAFQYGVLFEQFGSGLIAATAMQMPLWFAEGLAEYLSSGWTAEADMWLLDATVNGEVPLPGPQLYGYIAYKAGQSFIKFLVDSRGEKAFTLFLKRFRQIKNVEKCLMDVYGKSVEDLGREWHHELKRLYWPETGKRETSSGPGVSLMKTGNRASSFNTMPRLSPDGKKIAFYSDIRDYTRIIIADRKGKVLREAGRNCSNFDFESLHPFRCGLSWSPDGSRLAFAASSRGEDEIRIMDIASGKTIRRIRPHAASIYGLDWSPKGDFIAFAMSDSGRGDLMAYDVAADTCRRLTADMLFETGPRFSPDGGELVFSGQDSAANGFHPHTGTGSNCRQLWRIDLATGEKRRITSSACNKKSPCFAADGGKILYVSDANGIDNLVLADASCPDSAVAISDLIGMATDPDCARDAPAAAFTLYRKGAWEIRVIDTLAAGKNALQPAPTQWAAAIDSSRTLFPKSNDKLSDSIDLKIAAFEKKRRKKHDINRLLTHDTSGRSADTASRSYRPVFAPDILGFSIGASSRFGVYGQGIAVFSDLLGDRHFSVMGDVKGNINDYAHLHAAYIDLKRRINYGGAVFYGREYTPRRIAPDAVYSDAGGGAQLLLRFPLSISSRFDLEILAQQYERTSAVWNEDDGYRRLHGGESIETFDLMPSLSFAYDDILWASTGPLNGTRCRIHIEVSPPLPFVDKHFVSADVDMRRYFHLAGGLVWANRLSCGAALPINGNAPTRKYFLGGNESWLLFDYSSYNRIGYRENIHNIRYSQMIVPFRGWRYFDIIGERFVVFNSEFRFPLIKEIVLPFPLPFELKHINGAIFCDAGNAWDPGQQHEKIPLPKEIYGGIGFGLRANLGFFIVRYDRAWKTDWKSPPGPATDYLSLGAEF